MELILWFLFEMKNHFSNYKNKVNLASGKNTFSDSSSITILSPLLFISHMALNCILAFFLGPFHKLKDITTVIFTVTIIQFLLQGER